MDVLGPSGTLVMPAPSSDLTDPASWSAPPVPEAWRADIRATMPPYDPRTTPTWGMGTVAEQFRVTAAVNRAHIAVVHELLQRTRLGMEQLAERAGLAPPVTCGACGSSITRLRRPGSERHFRLKRPEFII